MFYAAILRLFLGDSKSNFLSGRSSNPTEDDCNVVPVSNPSPFGLDFFPGRGEGSNIITIERKIYLFMMIPANCYAQTFDIP